MRRKMLRFIHTGRRRTVRRAVRCRATPHGMTMQCNAYDNASGVEEPILQNPIVHIIG